MLLSYAISSCMLQVLFLGLRQEVYQRTYFREAVVQYMCSYM